MKSNPDFNDVFGRNYELVKMVLINSASHAYSEIPINEPLALFGKNNRGKTSSLAATKLLLYPEVNFNDCARKFNFTNKSGELYSKEQSYRHYFPISESFIALEVLNPRGVFTMLLYKVGNYEYHRLFFPCEYNAIRSLIWDDEADYFADTLGLDSLLAALKDMGGIQASERNKIKNIMYANFASSTSRYCVVPIKDQDEASVRAFTSMYELAFDAGKGEKHKLPNAIATIVEMQRSKKNEELDSDVHTLRDKRSELAAMGVKIKSLTDNEPLYRNLQSRFDDLYSQAQSAVIDLSVFNHLLSNRMESYAKSSLELINKKSKLEGEIKQVKSDLAKTSHAKNSLSAQIASISEDIKRKKARQISAQTVLGQYSSMTKRQVIDKMQAQVDDYKATAAALRSADATTKRMTEKTREQNNLRTKISSLEKSLSNADCLLATRLPSDTASILGSLNPAFMRLTTDKTIADSDYLAIERFVKMFSTDDQGMSFLGGHLQDVIYKPYDPTEQKARIADDIKSAKEKFELAGETIKSLNKSLAEMRLGQASVTVDDINKDINALVDTIRLLDGLDLIELELSEREKEVADKSLQLTAITEENSHHQARLHEVDGQYVQIVEQHEKMQRFGQDVMIIEKMLKGVKSAHGMPYLSSESDEFKKLIENTSIVVDVNTASTITSCMADIQQKVVTLIKDVSDFMRKVVLDDIDPNQQIDTLGQLGDVISQYKNSFSRLEYQQKNFNADVVSHNNLIDGLLKEIDDAARLLRTTISSLNSDLNKYKISNLNKVVLQLNLSPDFANLERTYKKHNAGEASLFDEGFYQSLIYYVERTSHSKSKNLKIINLIESINYEYETQAGEVEEKGQSGGTTSTITALVTTLLFGEVFMPHSKLKMPIIVDEVASIDKENIKTISEHVTNAGFTLICANPDLHSVALRYIPNYVFVDKSVLSGVVKAHGCELSLMPNAVNRLSEGSHDYQ